MKTHWDTKCLNCGHRKGSHHIVYEAPEADGRSVSRHMHYLASVGYCAVDRREFGEEKCQCSGFSDGKLWKDGKRIINWDKELK